jgi:hypothetical protein
MTSTTGFSGSPDCRWQIARFLGLHYCIIAWGNSHNKPPHIHIYENNTHTHNLLGQCFSEKPLLIHIPYDILSINYSEF